MPYQRITKLNSYSLTDFHDFDECLFRFFVRHHLDRKYEIATGSPKMALGVVLDQAIKNIHKYRAYNHPLDRILKVVRFSAQKIKEKEADNPRKPNFDSAVVPYLTEDVLIAAEQILKNYYEQINGKFQKSLMEVDFCKRVINIDGVVFQLWGGPDTIELGSNGEIEIIDYKSRTDISRGKQNMDMNLMPRMYTLLVADKLLAKGYDKAKFVVKFWQDPLETNFVQNFDLNNLSEHEDLFKERIRKILTTRQVTFCGGKICDACNSDKSSLFTQELRDLGFDLLEPEKVLLPTLQDSAFPLVIEKRES